MLRPRARGSLSADGSRLGSCEMIRGDRSMALSLAVPVAVRVLFRVETGTLSGRRQGARQGGRWVTVRDVRKPLTAC